MIRPATETHRGPTPLLAIGPGGSYVERWYATRHQMTQETTPASGVPLLKPVAATAPARPLPTDPNRERWSWQRFAMAVVMGLLIGLVIYCSIYGAVAIVHALTDAAIHAVGLGRYD